MSRHLLPLLLLATPAFAQFAESIPFRIDMSPRNEVPAITDLNATGFGTVWVHVQRDGEGKITSGTVDFTVRHRFPGAVAFTGLHIHRGRAGANGPVVIDTGITGATAVESESGVGQIVRSAQIAAGSAQVEVLAQMIASPEEFYLNLHSRANPGGAVRAQMARADRRVFGMPLGGENEVPAIRTPARGVGFVTLLTSFDAQNRVLSSEATFEVTYTGFAEGTQFTGMHIHSGSAGTNGPVTIDTGLTRAQNVLAGTGGNGSLRFVSDVNMGSQNAVNTILNIYADPGRAYLNLHTVANPGGEIRGQLRQTERLFFLTNMSPLNEVPAVTNLEAGATGIFEAHLLRRADATALAALGVFNINHRFPGATTFTGLHIHSGAAGTNGPVTLDSGIRSPGTVQSATGNGNIYRTAVFSTDAQVAALNRILARPADNYLNLHTTVNPGGAVRAQLTPANTNAPVIETILNGVSDPALTTLAPGGVMVIYGRDLALLAGNLEGWQGLRAPVGMNGTSVLVNRQAAPVLSVAPNSVVAQVPVEAMPGTVEVTVLNTNGPSPFVRATVAPAAPALFFDRINADGQVAVAYTLRGERISPENPAENGQMVGIFGTGFGVAMPRQGTGEVMTRIAGFPGAIVTVGGQAVRNARTVLVPGYVGFTETIFAVPGNLRGAQPVQVEQLGAKSNTVVIYLR